MRISFGLGYGCWCNFIYLRHADTQHQFNARESDWGFTSFMPLGELYDPSRGYLLNDTLLVEAEVLVRRIVDYWSYDSKKETGYVGLKNQGATCYMNSLLQTLYHIPYFRKVCIIGHNCSSYFCSFVSLVNNWIAGLSILYFRLCIICQQQRMTCPLEASLWPYKVCFTNSSTVTQVLQQRSWQNRLGGILMIPSCSMMFKN